MSSSRLRELRREDAEQVAALFVAEFGEARKLDAEEIRSWLANKELEPEWLRVLELDGAVAGYGDIWPKDDTVELDVVAPGHWDVFFDWAESEGRSRSLRYARTQVPHGHPLAALVVARGYAPWRHSLTMEIALDVRPAEAFPGEFTVRTYRDDDAERLRAALRDAFVDDPFFSDVTPGNFREFYLGARGFDPELWLLAFAGEELAGFSLAYPFRGTDLGLGWVGTLGVLGPWRRRGLGEALLRASFARLFDRGLRRVGLGVDAENPTGALRLYERAGMKQVRRSDSWRCEL